MAVAALPADPLAAPAGAAPERVLTTTASDGRLALVVGDGEEAERWLRRAARALGLEAPLAVGPAVAPAAAARSAVRATALLGRVPRPGRRACGRPRRRP